VTAHNGRVTVLLALTLILLVPQPAPASGCGTWQDCRDRALEAAARRDFETFHDLAWRAVNAGPRNDAALMQLLARAQSLSGRPGDALVMLQRLAAMGVVTDAATSEDFASVRRLPRWREFEAEMEARPASDAPAAAPAPPPIPTPAPVKTPVEPAPRPAPPPAAKPAPSSESATDAVRFSTPRFMPGGLAYDAVSRRFILGHRDARKLSVVDEFSRQIANLAGAQATGFADVTALEIDPRDGTLWVVSAGEPAADRTGPATSLHKLQLISGRALSAFSPPAGSDARFVDVAVAGSGAVLVLDAAGARVFRLTGGARTLEEVASLGTVTATSLAPAGGSIVYVAHESGIVRVDLSTRKTSPLGAGEGDLAGIDWLRWHKGALVALQRTADGHRVVRLKGNGDGPVRTQVLDADVRSPGRATAAITGDVLYVLAAGSGPDLVVKKLPLR
jgi:hypothetical protein